MSRSRRIAVAVGAALLVATPGVADARVTIGPGDHHGMTTRVGGPTSVPTRGPTSAPATGPTGTASPDPAAPDPASSDQTPTDSAPTDSAPTRATPGETGSSAASPSDAPTDPSSAATDDVPTDVRTSVPPGVATDSTSEPDQATPPTAFDPTAPDLRCDGPASVVDRDPGDDWRRVVVDPVRRLPTDWAPDDLVAVDDLAFRAGALEVRALLVHDLRAMHAAATAAHARFVVTSGFRSQERQQRLWTAEVERLGTPSRAAAGMARPGRSEHQLGTTIDVVDPSLPRLTPDLVDTPAGRWLAIHAADYGFVVSYPHGERATTCYKPEPWHLRYVGAGLARRFTASDDTLREFLLEE